MLGIDSKKGGSTLRWCRWGRNPGDHRIIQPGDHQAVADIDPLEPAFENESLNPISFPCNPDTLWGCTMTKTGRLPNSGVILKVPSGVSPPESLCG